MLHFIFALMPSPRRALLVLAATAILATGCAAVKPGERAVPLAGGEKAVAPNAPQDPETLCQVELKSKGGKTQVKKVALKGDEHVGDVLAQTGALRKYSNCEVSVLRLQPNGAIAKMKVSIAPNKRQVKAESDYFLYPKDRILVQEVETTAAEDAMLGMFGSMARKK